MSPRVWVQLYSVALLYSANVILWTSRLCDLLS